MNPENKKVVLAYSGGLDTTYCAIYLKKDQRAGSARPYRKYRWF